MFESLLGFSNIENATSNRSLAIDYLLLFHCAPASFLSHNKFLRATAAHLDRSDCQAYKYSKGLI
jgi:hypothetical protein